MPIKASLISTPTVIPSSNMIKICGTCTLEFDKTWSWGYNQCKPCNRTYQKAQRLRDVEGVKVKRRAYTARSYVRLKTTDYDQRRNYGISSEEKEFLLVQQGGCCAVCNTSDPGKRGWHTDHDHSCCPGRTSCGKCIRGILCHNCNMLLGHAKEQYINFRKRHKLPEP